jgi:hypothetical protein
VIHCRQALLTLDEHRLGGWAGDVIQSNDHRLRDEDQPFGRASS